MKVIPQRHLARIALITVVLLLIPLVGMQVSDSWNWTVSDFVIMGMLLFVAGLGVSAVVRKVQNRNHRLILVGAVLALFLYIWAELAVGIFTNLGS